MLEIDLLGAMIAVLWVHYLQIDHFGVFGRRSSQVHAETPSLMTIVMQEFRRAGGGAGSDICFAPIGR